MSADSLRMATNMWSTQVINVAQQSLEELKRENAAEEEAANTDTPVAEAEPEETAVEEPEESLEPSGEAAQEDEPAETIEAWQGTDEISAPDQQTKRGPSFAGLKKKLRGQIAGKDDVIATLRSELDELKAGRTQQRPVQAQQPLRRPTLEDVNFDEKAFAAAQDHYTGAFVDDRLAQMSQRQMQQAQIADQQAKQTAAVDQHYTRAEALVESGKIAEEAYKTADSTVRRSIESAMPGQGDAVTDFLLSRIGEGSEKVMVYLGNNSGPLAELRESLAQDPNGIGAAIYLGGLKSQITAAPKRRASNAPKPGSVLKGDAPSSAVERAAHKEYKSAGDDIQKRIDIKRAARGKGINTKGW